MVVNMDSSLRLSGLQRTRDDRFETRELLSGDMSEMPVGKGGFLLPSLMLILER